MGQPLRKLVEDYIGLAKVAPEPEIVLREAANRFAQLSMDPKNAAASRNLKDMALEFAAAARRPKRPATVSDFKDLLDETHAAIQEVGDGNALDIIARRGEIHDQRSNESPRVSIAPESFNDHSTLGRMAQIKYAPTQEEQSTQGIVQSQTVAFWQGTKREAQAMTVDVGLALPPPAADVAGSARPYAVVEFGSDGNRISVVLDVGFGVRFTVVGNYISVLVGMDPPLSPFPARTLTIGASIGAFAAPSTAPVIRTVYIDSLVNAGVTDPIRRPEKAVMLLPIQSDLPLGGTATLDFYGIGTSIMTTKFYLQSNSSAMDPVPLYGDVAFFRLTNGGALPANFRLPFQLSL